MNATELFTALEALPGVRPARVENSGDIDESRLVGGVEVAHVRMLDERRLRKAWRERADGGPVRASSHWDCSTRPGRIF